RPRQKELSVFEDDSDGVLVVLVPIQTDVLGQSLLRDKNGLHGLWLNRRRLLELLRQIDVCNLTSQLAGIDLALVTKARDREVLVWKTKQVCPIPCIAATMVDGAEAAILAML